MLRSPAIWRAGLALACALGATASLAVASATRPIAVPAQRGFTVLYRFKGYPDGEHPVGGVIVDAFGRIFGTTYAGGDTANAPGFGTVYELARSGGGYAESILYAFDGANGAWPSARPSVDEGGNLFITTSAGGPSGTNGTVLKLTPTRGGYVATASYAFPSTGGLGPEAALLQQAAGAELVTTTVALGGPQPNDFGSIVAFAPSNLAEAGLYDFAGAPSDGAAPTSHLVADTSGALYGTTQYGGDGPCAAGCGTVFRYVPATGVETVVRHFQGGDDGAFPRGGLAIDRDRNLYGTTSEGGGAGYGSVFKLIPDGRGGFVEKILHRFNGTDGGSPYAALTLVGSDLYGTSTYGGACGICGTIFRVSTTGGGYTVLHRFAGAGDGAQPFFSPLFYDGTALYGTAEYGGNKAENGQGDGVVFRDVP